MYSFQEGHLIFVFIGKHMVNIQDQPSGRSGRLIKILVDSPDMSFSYGFEIPEETAEDPYENESRALDAMFGGADEAAADGAAPAEPASPADAEEEY